MTELRIRDGISRVSTEYGDVLLDEDSGRYWHANPTAVLVLDTIERDGTDEHAAERIAAEFDTDADTARADVRELLTRLRELGVLA